MKQIKQILYLIIYFTTIIVSAQNYEQLVNEKETLLKESKLLNQSLINNKSTQTHTIEALNILNRKITVQEKILQSIELEIVLFQSEQITLESELRELNIELEKIKNNYAVLIQNTHHVSRLYNRLLFFLSASSFNQFIKRTYHLKQVEKSRRRQYKAIKMLKEKTENTTGLITQKKAKQMDLAMNKRSELKLLGDNKKQQEATVGFLKTKEDSLKKAIIKKEKATKKITSEILLILEKEKMKENKMTAEAQLISKNFEENKGRLPWPTIQGAIIAHFGEHPHPVLSGIKIMNNGVEISTNSNNVRSVFDGEVSKIIVLPNGLKVIIMRHGEYLTVYSDLYDVSVNIGDQLAAKDVIGSLDNIENENQKLLGFQIWKDRSKLNPKHWLSSY